MSVRIIAADCRVALRAIPCQSINAIVTSPPYFGLRNYKHPDQFGLEQTPNEFVDALAAVLDEARRTLRDDGVLWLNLGDSYAGSNRGDGLKPKDLIGIPWRVAFALQEKGWWLRSEVIWAKPNGMPGSQEDRCTSSHETIFLLSKSSTYWSDFDAIKTPPRESSLVRLSQNVQAQAGSHRANGGAKTNGPMKAVSAKPFGSTLEGSPHERYALGENVPPKERRSDKQRGHGRVHAGFNERWDAMEKSLREAMTERTSQSCQKTRVTVE